MQGYNVLHPMGWDAFGLPAEQFAITTGHHPEEFTKDNIANFTRQLKMLGFSYDWTKEFLHVIQNIISGHNGFLNNCIMMVLLRLLICLLTGVRN